MVAEEEVLYYVLISQEVDAAACTSKLMITFWIEFMTTFACRAAYARRDRGEGRNGLQDHVTVTAVHKS